MPSKRAEELRSLSREELEEKLRELRSEIFFEVESKLAVGAPPEKVHIRRQLRRDIARILTIMKEKGYI